jgi:methyl-accepting chemotaxis protein
MFKKMTLGARIGFGFGALLLILGVLGGYSMFQMRSARDKSGELANKYVPEAALGSAMQGRLQDAQLVIRSYGLTYDEKYLRDARVKYAQFKAEVDKTKQLSDKYPELTELRQQLTGCTAKSQEYEGLVDETEKAVLGMVKNWADLELAAKPLMASLDSLQQMQAKGLQEEASATASDKVKERGKALSLISDVSDHWALVRVAFWKAQCRRDPEMLRAAMPEFEQLDGYVKALAPLMHKPEEADALAKCKDGIGRYRQVLENLAKDWAIVDELAKKRVPTAAALAQAADALQQAGSGICDKYSKESEAGLSTASMSMAVGLGVAVFVGILLAIFITRGITGPIGRIIAGLTEGAEQVSAAAGQVSAASQSLAEGASEQASSLEETSSALEQMSAMTRTNAGNAKQANELAGSARKAADDGDKTMVQLNEAMNAINGSSEKISKIIKVIEEIAFQTNLLALNAAVEAARAGDHGKGFAVVADEVRNLAQRSAQAAKETTALIEDSVNRARGGTQVASEAGKALGVIVDNVSKVSELINGIAQASDEQAQGVEQVNTAVGQMDKVTQQNASGAEESASAAEELSAQAQTVNSMVAELTAMVGGASKANARAIASSKGSPDKKSGGSGKLHASARKSAKKEPAHAGATDKASSDEFLSLESDNLNGF